jgi:hypothetical protein
MPRYLVEQSFRFGLHLPSTSDGAAICAALAAGNAEAGVTWIHSYVSRDKRTAYALYEAPSPEAIRRAADLTGQPLSRITEVQVLDPHFYHHAEPGARA